MEFASRRRLVLNLHGVGPKPSHVEAAEGHYWCEDLATFRRLLDSIPEVAANSDTPIEITFDDGNESDCLYSLPELIDRGLRASFFVCAGRIGRPGYLDRSALTALVDAGMTVGSHGWGHVDWRKADQGSLTREVDEAKRVIEEVIVQSIEAVAIPFGSYDRRVINALTSFATVYTSDGGLAPRHGRFVPRISFNQDWRETSLRDFASQSRISLAAVTRALKSKVKRIR